MTELRKLQETFWSLIAAPAGVPNTPWIDLSIRSDPSVSAVERLEVYANMYFFRLLDNLGLDFPAVARSVGPAAFHNLITDYLHAHPSSGPSVRNVGRCLPRFLREHNEHPPWLAELAALEWTRLDVSDREDERVLTLDDLQRAASEGFASLQLHIITAHQPLPVRHAIEPLWRASQRDESMPAPRADARTLLVWRQPDTSIHHRPLDEDELELLPQLREGISFIDVCAALSGTRPAPEAAQRALTLLSSWVSAGLLRGPQPDT